MTATFGSAGKYEKHRPNGGDLEAGITQVATENLGGYYWRFDAEPGTWYKFGVAGLQEVPEREWRRFVSNPEQELATKKRLADLARVEKLIADASKGPTVTGEAERGFYLETLPGGMALVKAGDGLAMHPTPLPLAVAQGILEELRGGFEGEGEDAC